MAIVLEEEQRSRNWPVIITSIVIIAVLFFGAYYLFFKKPELIEVVVPGNLQDLTRLSGARFDPKAVVDSAVFKTLRDYSAPIALPPTGKDNPFQPF